MAKTTQPSSRGTLTAMLGELTVAGVGTVNRGGRPRTRPVQAGEKTAITLLVSPQVRKLLERLAALSGRSLTQETEFWVERALYDTSLAAQIAAQFEELRTELQLKKGKQE
jgi:hypothetical protein